MKYPIILFLFILLFACGTNKNTVEDKKLYQQLSAFVNNDEKGKISRFMVIPIDAACEGCRDRSIQYLTSNNLPQNAVVILSASKPQVMKAYLNKQKLKLKTGSQIIFDEKNEAFAQGLVFMQPKIYYFNSESLIEKVEIKPASIEKDLQIFFKQ